MNKESGILGGIAIVVIGIVIALFAFSSSKSTSTATVDKNVLVRADSYSTGANAGKVTVVEFGDYQCPACGAAYAPLKQLLANHQDITFIFRDFPLTQHNNAKLGAKAALAAGKQGQYWPMHDRLYEAQSEWGESNQARDLIVKYAGELKLNTDQFAKDLDSSEFGTRIDRDIQDGESLKVNATPTLYFNGVKYSGNLSLSAFEDAYKKAAGQ